MSFPRRTFEEPILAAACPNLHDNLEETSLFMIACRLQTQMMLSIYLVEYALGCATGR
jgi:hypothetical protein